MHEQLGVVLSAIAGSAISGFLAKAWFNKGLRDLEAVSGQMNDLAKHLAVLVSRVEGLERQFVKIEAHDRAIAVLTRSYKNGKTRGLHNTDS